MLEAPNIVAAFVAGNKLRVYLQDLNPRADATYLPMKVSVNRHVVRCYGPPERGKRLVDVDIGRCEPLLAIQHDGLEGLAVFNNARHCMRRDRAAGKQQMVEIP